MKRRFVLIVLSSCCIAPIAQAEQPIDFNRDIRSILSNACFACHGPDVDERQAGLRLDVPPEQIPTTDSGKRPIIPGDPDGSPLIRRITSKVADVRMPPVDSGKKLSDGEIQLLIDWIQQGAEYAKHWSYEKPIRPNVPDIGDTTTWPRNEIDYFILDRLRKKGMSPSSEADRFSLIRRLSLDLTGLPPALDEVKDFLDDREPGAYERLVDRLLAKTAYGEHWARMWLDLARYADSSGYADDPPRTIWAYRDYVIQSLNANKPFDQFTIEQIAGDLLPDPTTNQLIATAFHRNTMTNNEGGTNDEEFRNVAIVDRVNTTMAVWMGTTIDCAQCHNHKYDPITQEEYFRMFAFFNNTEDADRRDESPVVVIWSDEQKKRRSKLRAEIAAGYDNRTTPRLQSDRDRLAKVRKQLTEMKPYTTVPRMRRLAADKLRTTKIQRRGNFLDTTREVTAGTPAAFHPLPDGEPRTRLTLAKWLMDDDNPLTARVIANRYWEAIFGIGIVRTSEEFGTQGDPPSHPKLLDWLATELLRLDWDTKAFVSLLVTSAAYRQTSAVNDELLQRDPDNRLLARGPRFRLSAEMIRDQALFVSGLLSSKMYGPPVKPPQPNIGLNAAFGSGIDWKTSQGDDKYRRGLYTSWRRSNPYPSMAAFDAPNREVCTVRRDRTNTPLQALVTLNDPVYVEAAQALARRMMDDGKTARDKLLHGFQLCLTRRPNDAELTRLITLYHQAVEQFARRPDAAKRMATQPVGAIPEGVETVDLAAWTVVANVLLNLDEMFLKR